ARALAGAAAPQLWQGQPSRSPLYRHPQTRPLPSRPRHRAPGLPRPNAQHYHRPMAEAAVAAPAKAFPPTPEPLPLARFAAAPDLRAAIGLWVAWLAGERRA